MKRRDFLKGIATVPVIAAMPSLMADAAIRVNEQLEVLAVATDEGVSFFNGATIVDVPAEGHFMAYTADGSLIVRGEVKS